MSFPNFARPFSEFWTLHLQLLAWYSIYVSHFMERCKMAWYVGVHEVMTLWFCWINSNGAFYCLWFTLHTVASKGFNKLCIFCGKGFPNLYWWLCSDLMILQDLTNGLIFFTRCHICFIFGPYNSFDFFMNINQRGWRCAYFCEKVPDSKVHGANMRPIWGRQDPGGPHVCPMNFVVWELMLCQQISDDFLALLPNLLTKHGLLSLKSAENLY